jgi:putative transferase (TIGR04331 family)
VTTFGGTTGTRVSLATTALEGFWDTSKPILYLGEWCLADAESLDMLAHDDRLLASPWRSVDEFAEATLYVNGVIERLLEALSVTLNQLHGTQHGKRFWRILLGPWLQFYVPMLYDRFKLLQAALSEDPQLTTIVLAMEDWIVPLDTMEAVELNKGDAYNLQIMSSIFKLLNHDFPEKNFSVRSIPLPSRDRRSYWSRVGLGCWRIMSRVLGKCRSNRRTVYLKTSGFPKMARVEFALRTFGAVQPLPPASNATPGPSPDKDLRMDLAVSISPKDEFETLLSGTVGFDIPVCYVEGFGAAAEEGLRHHPQAPFAILSANGWYYDEGFKQWAARSSESGSLLLGVQHGGSYGHKPLQLSVRHELDVTDRFYSWGWNWCVGAQRRPFPKSAGKFLRRKTVEADKNKKGILYISTSTPRYLYQFPLNADFFSDYLSWQSRFGKSLVPGLVPLLRVRLHREDLGWNIERRWKDVLPDVQIEDWSASLWESVVDSRLVVCDNAQTTYLEVLSLNQPCVLFWNPVLNGLRPEAQPYYDQLRSVGILHDAPESAASTVNAVYQDVEAWWNDSARQSARLAFCQQFALMTTSPVLDWVDEFKRLLAGEGVGESE